MSFIERNGDGGGRGVAVFMKVDEDFFVRNRKAIRDGIDDAEIGLVWDDEGDVI